MFRSTPSFQLHRSSSRIKSAPGSYWPDATNPFEARVGLSEVVSALSFALDLTEDALPGHALRSCILGMRIGIELGLHEAQLNDLYYALLLKDIGCSSNSASMCQVLGGDERKAKGALKTINWTDSALASASWAWTYALPGKSPWRKILHLASMTRHGERNKVDMFRARSECGAEIVRRIGLGEGTASAIYSLDEHWNGGGFPDHLTATGIPLLARILAVAQHLDIFANEHGQFRAVESLKLRTRTWFDPQLVQVAVSLHHTGKLWTGCNTPQERARVIDFEPGTPRTFGQDQIDLLCEAFAEVVDAKSPMTYRHSIGVMQAANAISGKLGLPPERRRAIHRAALLHDLGKLRVPNIILDKPGSLNEYEWRIVREHPLLSQRILERIPSFAAIATISGRHHERLDGNGYPNRLKADQLSLDDRTVTISDVFSTLSEHRPYRERMSLKEIRGVLRFHTPHKLDPTCLDALLVFMDELEAAQPDSSSRPALSTRFTPAPLASPTSTHLPA